MSIHRSDGRLTDGGHGRRGAPYILNDLVDIRVGSFEVIGKGLVPEFAMVSYTIERGSQRKRRKR